jgi:hypothetical protein
MKRSYNGLVLIFTWGKTFFESFDQFPSIQFGVEMAFQSLGSETPFLLFPSAFTREEINCYQWQFGWANQLL